ncbi:MAG: hypothetical protein HC869_16230 [Rhodospirillales bacterium]|nr:hypothetical protein [Rhodospirillales bacterium]
MSSLMRCISALAVMLVWVLVGASLVRVLVPLFQRLFSERAPSFELEEAMRQPLAWLLAFALLLGSALAWRIASAGPQDAECCAYRSTLSVWPGWPLSIVGFVLAAAVLLLSGIAPLRAFGLVLGALDSYTFAIIPLVLATCAAATGGHSSQAVAFLAAPTLLITSVGLVGETSITDSAVAVLVAWAILAAGFAVLAAITGRELLMWLAIGFASLAFLALPLATGLFTPSEAVALIARWPLSAACSFTG